jgi:hypothetical protein
MKLEDGTLPARFARMDSARCGIFDFCREEDMFCPCIGPNARVCEITTCVETRSFDDDGARERKMMVQEKEMRADLFFFVVTAGSRPHFTRFSA